VANELTVPALPCRSIDEVEAFYTALGFTRTYRQVRPNPYLALRWEDIELHFFGIPDLNPQDSYSTCLVFVPDIASTFRAFAEGMRGVYGKLLVSGIPRMTRPRKRKNAGGLTGFTVVDPGGNWIRFSVRESKDLDEHEVWKQSPASASKLAAALHNAVVIGDSHGDHRQAAKVLDGALARAEDPPKLDLVEALLYRAELAVRLSDRQRARELLTRVRELEPSLGLFLDASERERLTEALASAADLDAVLSTN
jgi:catechol 2,3-dioxygenase-like lactoylglutathione lyase family enzyme